jgi:hypothetical protein
VHRAAAAKARKTSVASVIREAIDQALPGVDPAERRRAADELLAAEPIELPEPEELKREIREARYGGL